MQLSCLVAHPFTRNLQSDQDLLWPPNVTKAPLRVKTVKPHSHSAGCCGCILEWELVLAANLEWEWALRRARLYMFQCIKDSCVIV